MNAPQSPEPVGDRPAGPGWLARLRALGEPPADAAPGPLPKPHRWGFGAFLLAQLVFLLTSVFIAELLKPASGSELTATRLVLTLTLPIVLAATVAVVATKVRGNGPLLDLRLEWRWADVGVGLAVGAIGLIPTLIATRLWSAWMGKDQVTSSVSSILGDLHMSPTVAAVVFLHVWLLAPLCEEIVYRGLLWGACERLGWHRWSAFFLTTAVFAGAHLEPERTPLLLVIAIPIGLARLITGRLLASIVAHQVNNLLPAVGMLLTMTGVMPA